VVSVKLYPASAVSTVRNFQITAGWRVGQQQRVRCADTPGYLEVDELCVAYLLLREPLLAASEDPLGLRRVPFLTLKCYNWKYLT